MPKTCKTYAAEFKLQACRMVTDQHLAVAEVARRLGVSETRLHDWLKAIREGGAGAFPGHGRLSPQDEELHRLRAENARLPAERDILKKLGRQTWLEAVAVDGLDFRSSPGGRPPCLRRPRLRHRPSPATSPPSGPRARTAAATPAPTTPTAGPSTPWPA
jgi:transposase